jgi:hypothetical protein
MTTSPPCVHAPSSRCDCPIRVIKAGNISMVGLSGQELANITAGHTAPASRTLPLTSRWWWDLNNDSRFADWHRLGDQFVQGMGHDG